MPTFINTNMNSLNVQMALNASQTQQSTAMERLATGLKINSAADNAAGFAIVTRMTSQIGGDTQAAANANDAISLTQTAAGDLTQITNNLQTMRNLAVQASNATNSASDRAALNNQLQSLSAEIQRVSQTSAFNGVKLLDGSFTAQTFQVGANSGANNQIQIASIASASTSQLGAVGGTSYSASAAGALTTSGLAAGSLTLNGVSVGASAMGVGGGQSTSSATSIANAINAVSATSGVTATAVATSAAGAALLSANAVAISANTFSINGVNVGAISAGGTPSGQGANVAAAINLVSSQSGVTASANATTGVVTLTAADGRNINITANTNMVGGALTQITSASLALETGFASTLSDTAVGSTAVTLGAVTATVNGISVSGVAGSTVLASAQNFVSAFNTAAAAATFGQGISGITASTDSNGVISLTSIGSVASIGISATSTSAGFAAAATYASQHGSVNLSSSNANGLVIGGSVVTGVAGVDGLTRGSTAATTSSSNMTTIASVDISTAAGAVAALATIDGALAQVTASQAALGAYQNRFTSVVTSLQTTATNLTASQSRIQSTDYAAETANLSRAQILQQAGNAMLAQANQLPNQVMTLLR